jgi:hypothetical protein
MGNLSGSDIHKDSPISQNKRILCPYQKEVESPLLITAAFFHPNTFTPSREIYLKVDAIEKQNKKKFKNWD